MIRRQVGQEYWLIAQHDHAMLAGQLGRHVTSGTHPAPSCEPALRGIDLHDSGWPLHDDKPTLNEKDLPLDVFESPRSVTLPVWERSVEIAMDADPYAGLLVSLHVLALSTFATQQRGSASSSWNTDEPRVRFEVNRFQHRMIEIQEMLRVRLGMRIDQPLKNGLAERSTEPVEKRLIEDLWWLQAMDILSLCICCTRSPIDSHSGLGLRMTRKSEAVVGVERWPFKERQISVDVPFRRISARKYADQADLLAALSSTQVETFTARIEPTRMR